MIEFTKEVQDAIASNHPVVALESTIISHGMPYPQNVETALRVEKIVRDAGAIPATCAVMNGKLKAGLNAEELEWFGQQGTKINKASRRDLPWILSTKSPGATTVAATMIIAHKAGIRIFATGGIGGVHRGADKSMDISADLQELAHTPVAVVSAGVKSILDIGLTLEYLETFGVPVLGFKTSEFPAFFSRKSGFNVNYTMETHLEIANLLNVKWNLDPRGGVIIANPVPELYSNDNLEPIISAAIVEANQAGISGKDITPFLLGYIEKLSGGESLKTNIELVCNNARLAAEIACCYKY